MKPHTLAKMLGSISTVSAFAAMATPACAQDPSATEATELQTIVVKGEKVERDIMDTPSSVTVLGAEELEGKKGALTISDAIRDVPNVAYTSTVGAPIIRGQDAQGPNFGSTAFFGGTIPRASINLDGHYLNYYEYVFGGTSIWDVEDVEVFRGPQTTSQGANAIAGAIIVNTKDPTFTPEGALQVEYGSYNMKRAAAMLSGPLVQDQLAARVAIDYWGRDTFIDYINSGFNQGDTDQNLRTLNARAKLLWEPAGLSGFSAKLTYSHLYNNRPTYESASFPYEDLNNATTSMPSWEQDTDTGILDIHYEFDNGLKLHNQSQYSKIHVDRVAAPAANGSAVIDQQNMTNELRLIYGDTESRFSGVAGLFLGHTVSDETLYIRGTSDYDDEKDNLGVYMDVTYKLTDRWTLTAGQRFQYDHIHRTGSSPYAAGVNLDYDESFGAWLPKISLAYDLTPGVTVGALVSRGYNPGGINLSFASADYISFDPETVWNYELFGRARLLDDRLTLTGNLFYSDTKNSQRLLPDYLGTIQYGSVVYNADHATTYGLELGIDYQVLDNVRLKGGAGLLHTEIGEFTNAATGTTHEGNEFGGAPGYMLSAGVSWDILPEVTLSGEVRFTDGYYSTDENDPDYEVDSYTIANARLTYQPHENFQVFGYVNNIFDERAETEYYDDRTLTTGIAAKMVEPRMFGIGLKATF
jgi:iron complex outermembrane receptor protein